MLRFFGTNHGYVDRILARRLTAVSHIHIPAKLQDAEIASPGLVDPSFHGSHPWPEWVELMELLLKKGYFGGGVNQFDNGGLGSKESNHIRTACLNFARHRFALVRYMSREDIRVIAGCGCPRTDRKVVNSGKRLRAHVGVEEGNVCSSCNLRGECERAYVKVREEEGARTVDVMRLLLTYGLDSVASTMENRMCRTKFVEDSVRKLLREIVEYSSKDVESAENPRNELKPCSEDNDERDTLKKPGDWQCPQCKFLNFARNIRCLRCDAFSEERLQQLKGEQKDHLPLKKGDWICETCNFLNFAKNTRCLRCKEKPPKRELNPGEWECESCNYLNFRRNSVCLKCDHRRPKASKAMDTSAQCKNGTATNDMQSGVSKPWIFVEEETEKRRARISGKREDEGFMDFPVEGGSSIVSRGVERREKWKSEMSERMRSDAGGREEEDNVGTECSQYERRKLELLGNTSDDGEMDEWFVPKGRFT